MSGENRTPTYDLARLKELVRTGHKRVTGIAVQGAYSAGLEPSDIVPCVLALEQSCFYKSMEAEKRAGFFQDVYRPRYKGVDLYVKLQMETNSRGDCAVIIQFKEL